MITQIHIQNFKSLKDVTLHLQPVNLLIGPNNSGKTNLLKALEFAQKEGSYITSVTYRHLPLNVFIELFAKKNSYKLSWTKTEGTYSKKRFYNDHVVDSHFPSEIEDNRRLLELMLTIDFLAIYRPNPLKFTEAQAISSSISLSEDASNLIPFLETLRDEYRENFAALEADLSTCIDEFQDIRFKTVESPAGDNRTYKKWGLFSKVTQMIYWADELSEGVLYFVALLCIVHQPNPPKLLLLEEPERGIHPRRIKQVIDFIFKLAQTKDIQVIMTTHHPYILNEFEDLPEAVFVFDKDEEGATQIKNLQKDIIELSNEQNDTAQLPRIKFTQDLAEHWFSGFLGGVPA
jgi:predicted ATPase